MNLRDYQQTAHDKVIEHLKKSLEPCLIEAPTGAGKSHIIAAIAKTLYGISKKRILCLAPSKELVQQNHAKYLATGNQASIYSASITKSLRHDVIFGTPISIKNDIKKFRQQFCAVVIDECHQTTPSILSIIDELKEINENLRVIGLTATPQRMGEGLIYGHDKLYTKVYEIDPKYLIEHGFLCDVSVIYPSDENYYSTVNFAVQRNGLFKSSDLHEIECSHEKTARIVHDILAISQSRKGKTLIFATSVKHALECYSLLPKEISGIVTGESKSRDETIARFKSGKLKYLVNVKVLTTGFDAPDIDTIALLRPTESKTLLQQMVGRGLRPHPIKTECFVLDYAENIKRHCVDDRDIFSTVEETERIKREQSILEVTCPCCGYKNEFSKAYNPDKLDISKFGYFMTLDGFDTEIPAHMGRRCTYTDRDGIRCGYRWVSKICSECNYSNDIAARYCSHCENELINPDDKLVHENKEHVVEVKGWEINNDKVSKNNRKMTIIKFKTDEGEIPVFYVTDANPSIEKWLYHKYYSLKQSTNNLRDCPKQISYFVKNGYVNITRYA